MAGAGFGLGFHSCPDLFATLFPYFGVASRESISSPPDNRSDGKNLGEVKTAGPAEGKVGENLETIQPA
jgi:hypothetical protein